jgi:23S rRNA pseudouridine1911/1915/1917 synthase
MITTYVTDLESPQRIDVYLASQDLALSRSSIRKLFDDDKISCNGALVTQKQLVKNGDNIVIDFDIQTLEDIPTIDLPILYEDEDCIVLEKPGGLLTHSKGVFNPEATVASFIRPKVSSEVAGDRAGIVHRLDRATSGVMICAKNASAQSWLQKQFAQRKVKKTYVALVAGDVQPSEAVIDIPIARDSKNKKRFKPHSDGKPALTHYRVIDKNDVVSLVELKPTTGRTHQLRVHLAHVKHPIIGDDMYDGLPAKRLYLHAHQLEITLPSRERKVFTSPVPKVFTAMEPL